MKNMPLLLSLSRHPRADRSFRYAPLISGFILLLLVVQATQAYATTPAADTTSQLTSTVMTNHFSVYFVYPTSASPGQSEQISVTTTATSGANIISFSIDISSFVNGQPMKLASQTILGSTTVQTGAKWQTLFTVNVPADAQAGPLIGTVTEVWQQSSGSYYSSPYYYHALLHTELRLLQHLQRIPVPDLQHAAVPRLPERIQHIPKQQFQHSQTTIYSTNAIRTVSQSCRRPLKVTCSPKAKDNST